MTHVQRRPHALWGVPRKAGLLLGAVRIEHSLFALPYGYLGMVLAAGGLPTGRQFLWITVAMVAARTLGFAANRVLDRFLDAANPRTANRALPQGLLRPGELVAVAVVSIVLFVVAAAMLNTLALALTPVAVMSIVGYSFLKRFSWATHFAIGWVDAMAPAGAWIGVAGALPAEALLLAFAVAMFLGGLDIIYNLPDVEFDRAHGLHTIPQAFGIPAALKVSAGLHVVTVVSLLAFGLWMDMAFPYFVGCVVASALLAYQDVTVSPTDLGRTQQGAFQVNLYVGPAVLVGGLVALYV